MSQNIVPSSRGERVVGWLSTKRYQLEDSLAVAAERQSHGMTRFQKIALIGLGVPGMVGCAVLLLSTM